MCGKFFFCPHIISSLFMASLVSLKKLIDKNDAKGLASLLKKNPPPQDVLQEALLYASLLGDDQGIRVLFLHGAVPTVKAVRNAMIVSETKGHGGHVFAGLYVKSVMQGHVHPETPFKSLHFAE